MTDWLATPAGGYVLQWEQRQLDQSVVDFFGFHALQLGLPELDALRTNRIPHQWVATEVEPPVLPARSPAPTAPARSSSPTSPAPASIALDEAVPPQRGIALCCDFDALPFDTNSLDLVVLPHALELARDPHLALREVERVLVPEGRVVIVGFNPSSLWGLRQRLGHWQRRWIGPAPRGLFLPAAGEYMRYRRLRDWLRLLSFEVEEVRFGCYRLPVATERWLARFGWLERLGTRWWPVFGAVYCVVAVKRVRGMRLIGLARAQRTAAHPAPAPVVASHHHRGPTSTEE